ncbi:hypothetical protein CDN99_26050 [Roseateles aquatilis]|uniref:Uncharacterized protein n=1 Tax=Roseateles aquatilis TaxID=431061 RepID=A0A246ITQ1_9BURK|nr:hypothetical protein [Roseateles aquatilis]OWQ83595.1 hypothetical protein CDN99_26050 [Roseateles aquatilis]
MIGPRLTPLAVIESATLCSPFDVAVSDPRLAGIDQTWVRGMALMTPLLVDPKVPLTYFVEWPDRSLGIAHLWTDEPRRSEALLDAYAAARQTLEKLALDCFFLYDPAMPH